MPASLTLRLRMRLRLSSPGCCRHDGEKDGRQSRDRRPAQVPPQVGAGSCRPHLSGYVIMQFYVPTGLKEHGQNLYVRGKVDSAFSAKQ